MRIFLILTVLAVLLISGNVISQNIKEGTESKRALFVVTSHDQLGNSGQQAGWYLPEVAHPYFVLTEAGYEIDFVSPKGGKTPMDEKSRDLTDALNREFVETPALIGSLDNTMSPSQVQPRNYDVIFFAGGHGTMWDFPKNSELAQIAAKVYERGGIIAAVVHGPAALLNIKLSNDKYLLKGKTVTSYTNEEESISELSEVVPFALETALIKRGAKFTETIEFKPHVVVSERLITGQNPASAAEVAQAILRLTEKLEDPELQVSK